MKTGMTYSEMLANDADGALYVYTENGHQMGIGTRHEIQRTVREMLIDIDTMRFELVR